MGKPKPEMVSVTIRLPKALVEIIDADADMEDRDRTKQIAKILKDKYMS